MRISISPYEYPYAHTNLYAHKHAYIPHAYTDTYLRRSAFAVKKSFTVKQRKYSINISIKSLAIRNQHYTNLIVKTWQNVKTNKTDMQIYTWDGKCATATELLLLVVSGAVVLPAPRTVSNICCSVKYKWNQVFQLEFILVQTGWRIACDPSGISNIWTTFLQC